MKLVKTTTPKIGFVCRRADWKVKNYPWLEGYLSVISLKDKKICFQDYDIKRVKKNPNEPEGVFPIYEITKYQYESNFEVVGKLGKTHAIKDGKLVELPRKEIKVGDVRQGMTKKFVISYLGETKAHLVYEDGEVGFSKRSLMDACPLLGSHGIGYEIVGG